MVLKKFVAIDAVLLVLAVGVEIKMIFLLFCPETPLWMDLHQILHRCWVANVITCDKFLAISCQISVL